MEMTVMMIILKSYILLLKLKKDALNIKMVCIPHETNLCTY